MKESVQLNNNPNVTIQKKETIIYYRLYFGNAHTPARLWTVAWCTTEELPKAIKNGWLLDNTNLFGPMGKYPRKLPKELL